MENKIGKIIVLILVLSILAVVIMINNDLPRITEEDMHQACIKCGYKSMTNYNSINKREAIIECDNEISFELTLPHICEKDERGFTIDCYNTKIECVTK